MAGTMTAREPRAARPSVRRGPFAALRQEMQDLVSQVLGEESVGLLSEAHLSTG